jgi:hypothetical protein
MAHRQTARRRHRHVTRPACDPRCYWLLPHKPLPNREALVLWIRLRPFRQVADIWLLRPEDSLANPCGIQVTTASRRRGRSFYDRLSSFDLRFKTRVHRIICIGGYPVKIDRGDTRVSWESDDRRAAVQGRAVAAATSCPPPSRSRAGASSGSGGPHTAIIALPIAMANIERTFWSPKWSPTRDHGPILNGTKWHARPIFPIQINTCWDRTKRVRTTVNKFRVRCFQLAGLPI